MNESISVDYLIIGAGIIGLSIAKALIEKYPRKQIIILEKENSVGEHSSGRNSGVLHAGFYYSADSLKARFTRDGNNELRSFCHEHGIRINDCGKVVVTKNWQELDSLKELARRGDINGAGTILIGEDELHRIEPNAKTYKQALYSPNTATVDPKEVVIFLSKWLIKNGVKFLFGEGYYRKASKNSIITTKGNLYTAGIIINSAGLYADKVAQDFGFAQRYTIIPFKGVYLKYKGESPPVNTNVYPVPDMKNPFLGVHFTVTVDKLVKIGPTSMPAFWRENYSTLNRFDINELASILSWEAKLFFLNSFGFRDLAIREIKKYNKDYFTQLAGSLVKKMDKKGFKEWGEPGIRAQLLNKNNNELVMDFVVEYDNNSLHVLNAVSPAFTCGFTFARYIVENYLKK